LLFKRPPGREKASEAVGVTMVAGLQSSRKKALVGLIFLFNPPNSRDYK
jgi:hypothetical protein